MLSLIKTFFAFLFLFISPYSGMAQNSIDPIFAPFKGTAYKIPSRQTIPGYRPFIYKLEMAGETTLNKIDIPERNYKIPFPGLKFMHRFCIVFHSEMTIPKKAVYIFSLNSDDGSTLWIDNNVTINNDGEHQMTYKSDTLLLDKGSYPIKLWYFQGFPDRYGLEFKSAYYKDYNPETDKKYTLTSIEPKLVFNSTRLPFETNSHLLNKKGIATLDSLSHELNKKEITKITIHGHTDNTGPEKYNKELSIKRAETIKKELIKRLANEQIEFIVDGFGIEQPVTTNETKLGRSINRRVEIKIE